MEEAELDGHAAEDEEPSDSNLRPATLSWNPSTVVFRPYSSMGDKGGSGSLPRPLRIIVNKPLVVRLTKDIIETYQICQPTFTYSESFNPKRYLTNPSIGVLNNGLDNLNSDYILAVNAVLVNSDTNQRYIVKDLLGQGTFGQVVKCWSNETSSFVAVKVIKNQPAYYHQALVEISILTMLNQKFDPEDKHHIVRVHDHFVFHGHLCIAFEMLGVNLYELIRVNQFRGISLNLLKLFAKQILDSLLVLRDANVIHCDLKPENILLTTSLQSAEIKLIDFGSACMENRTVYSYIQSRFYRSPEVLLGYPYTTAIDMWSFGCIAAELFLGLPLFPGASEYDLMKRMIERLGCQPPDQMLRTAKNTSKYFKCVGCPRLDDSQAGNEGQTAYHFLSELEYEARELKKPASGKLYFNYVKLEDIIFNYPYRKKMTEEELAKESQTRLSFIDFLRGLVQFDPVKRWTPRQAVQHPFVTEEPFIRPYRPFPETPHTPVCQGVTVDHNPCSGHWFGAGLSPQAVNVNVGIHYTSPQHQTAPFNYASSYGSLGSYGSYGEGIGLGSSIGSYGDTNVYTSYCPLAHSALNSQAHGVPGRHGVGQNPETCPRILQVPHGRALGISPSSCMFRPMSLGLSPSQFTPPSSQVQLSPASPIGSPGRYGPTSPARGIHGTALGKAAVVGQYHKRMGLGMPGSLHLPSQDNIMPHWQGHSHNYSSGNVDMGAGTYMDGNVQVGYLGSPHGAEGPLQHQPCRQRAGIGISTGSATIFDQKALIPYSLALKGALLPMTEMYSDGRKGYSPPPDPGDWDPNYSDDLLFQEDSFDLLSPTSGARGSIQRGQVSNSATSSGVGFDRSVHSCIQLQGACNNSNFHSYFCTICFDFSCDAYVSHRPNGLVQGCTSVEGSPLPVHGQQLGSTHAMLKPLHQGTHLPQQNSPSRLGQQPSPFFQQHFHHQYHPQQNPDQKLPSHAIGQPYKHHYYPSFNLFPVDQSFQSGNMPHSQCSFVDHGGNSSSYSLLSPQRDPQTENAQFMASTRFLGASGMNSFLALHSAAPRLVRTGQRNDHPLSAVPASIHGTQD